MAENFNEAFNSGAAIKNKIIELKEIPSTNDFKDRSVQKLYAKNLLKYVKRFEEVQTAEAKVRKTQAIAS